MDTDTEHRINELKEMAQMLLDEAEAIKVANTVPPVTASELAAKIVMDAVEHDNLNIHIPLTEKQKKALLHKSLKYKPKTTEHSIRSITNALRYIDRAKKRNWDEQLND